MPKDATVQVALIGIITTLITTAGIVLVTIINNRKERGGAADAGVEGMLRERIVLRDEQILDLKRDLEEALAERDAAREENEEKTLLLHAARQELATLRRGTRQ